MLKSKAGKSRRKAARQNTPDQHLTTPLFVMVTKDGAELPLVTDRPAFPLVPAGLQHLGRLAGAPGHENELGDPDTDGLEVLHTELAE